MLPCYRVQAGLLPEEQLAPSQPRITLEPKKRLHESPGFRQNTRRASSWLVAHAQKGKSLDEFLAASKERCQTDAQDFNRQVSHEPEAAVLAG